MYILYVFCYSSIYVILMLDMFLAMAIARSQNYKILRVNIPKICQIWKNFGRGKPWQMPPLTEE